MASTSRVPNHLGLSIPVWDSEVQLDTDDSNAFDFYGDLFTDRNSDSATLHTVHPNNQFDNSLDRGLKHGTPNGRLHRFPIIETSTPTSMRTSLDPGLTSSETSEATTPSPTSPTYLLPLSPPLIHTTQSPDEYLPYSIRKIDLDDLQDSQRPKPETYIRNWLEGADSIFGLNPPTAPLPIPPYISLTDPTPRDGHSSQEQFEEFEYDCDDNLSTVVTADTSATRDFIADPSNYLGTITPARVKAPLAFLYDQNQDNTMDYDSDVDGDSLDERILKRNTIIPWPYDLRGLYEHDPQPRSRRPKHKAITAAAALAGQRSRPRIRADQALRRTASRLVDKANALFSAKKSDGTPHKISRSPLRCMLNSEIPHPDWGSFPFRSADDDLESDDDDGDVAIWLTRVVRANDRNGRDAFRVIDGIHRPMTILEYEKKGSWVFEKEWQEERQALARQKEREAQKLKELQEKMEAARAAAVHPVPATILPRPAAPRGELLSRAHRGMFTIVPKPSTTRRITSSSKRVIPFLLNKHTRHPLDPIDPSAQVRAAPRHRPEHVRHDTAPAKLINSRTNNMTRLDPSPSSRPSNKSSPPLSDNPDSFFPEFLHPTLSFNSVLQFDFGDAISRTPTPPLSRRGSAYDADTSESSEGSSEEAEEVEEIIDVAVIERAQRRAVTTWSPVSGYTFHRDGG